MMLAVISRHQKIRWTYAELQRRVDAFAGGLIAQEVGCFPPDVITNPARHVLNALSNVTPFPLSKSNMKDNILEAARAKLRSEGDLGKANAYAGGTMGTTSELIRSEDLPSVSRNDNTNQVAPATLRAQPAIAKTNPALKPTAPVSS
eukprot:gene9426-12739_t